ncbi:glycosyl transferase, partial [Nostoc sp. 'Peltigera malacea cyanobiont' DB3992]
MKRIMFYCQHILGMGHLVRSREIVRGLTKDFQVCFINGGEIIQGFE